MLDYNNDTVNSNSVPSLRQKMINEALNYHQNMNSVVFKRQAKNVGVYNNPSGKTDPSQGDILIEGTIRQRISDIQAAIQRLNQTVSYSNNITLPRAVAVNPRGVAHVSGSGLSGGAPKKKWKGVADLFKTHKDDTLEKSATGYTKTQLEEYANFRDRLYRFNLQEAAAAGASGSSVKRAPVTPYPDWEQDSHALRRQEALNTTFPPTPRQTPTRKNTPNAKKPVESINMAVDPPSSSSSEASTTSSEPLPGYIKGPKFVFDPDELERERQETRAELAAKAAAKAASKKASSYESSSRTGSTESTESSRSRPTFSEHSGSTGKSPYSGVTQISGSDASSAPSWSATQRSDIQGSESGNSIVQGLSALPPMSESSAPSQSSVSQPLQPLRLTSYADSEPSDSGDEGGEPPAAGVVTSRAPDAKSSSKIKQLIDNSLAAIVTSYNSLIEFIDLQKRQRAFQQRDEQSTASLLRELIEPLKLLISNSAQLRESDPVNGNIEYSRIYNVLSDLLTKIQSSPPFLKVDFSLLTEAIPLRRDIISASNFDASKEANHTYLNNLADRLKESYDAQIRFHPKSPLEKQAQQLKLKEIEGYVRQITAAGYKPSSQHVAEMEDAIRRSTITSLASIPTEEEEYAMGYKPHLKQSIQDLELRHQHSTQEVENLEDELQGVKDRIDEIITANNQIEDRLEKMRETYHDKIDEYNQIEARLSNVDFNMPREEIESFLRLGGDRLYLLSQELQDLVDMRDDLMREQSSLHPQVETFRRAQYQIEDELNDVDLSRRTFKSAAEGYKQDLERQKPLRKSYKSKVFTKELLEKERPALIERRNIHGRLQHKELATEAKRKAKMLPFKAKAKLSMEGPFGSGKSGGDKPNPHKPSPDPFGDNSELEPYLTKYLRPSKHRQVKDVPAIESSSDESSGDEHPKKIKKPVGGKRGKKLKEDFEIIETQLHPDKAILIEKKTKTKRIGRGKTIQATKPAHTMRPEQDLWFI